MLITLYTVQKLGGRGLSPLSDKLGGGGGAGAPEPPPSATYEVMSRQVP